MLGLFLNVCYIVMALVALGLAGILGGLSYQLNGLQYWLLEPLNDEKCEILFTDTDLVTEDFQRWKDNLYVGGLSPPVPLSFKESGVHGLGLFTFDGSEPTTSRLIPLVDFPPGIDFNPHGVSILDNLVYVINHAWAKGGERIDVFSLEDTGDRVSARFLYTFDSFKENLLMNNDVYVRSRTEFYYTEWLEKPCREHCDPVHGEKGPFDDEFSQKFVTGNLNTKVKKCTHDGAGGIAECSTFAENIAMANGINSDGKLLYVSELRLGNLLAFDFDGNAVPEKNIDYDGHIDNINYNSETGIFFGTGAPNLFQAVVKELFHLGGPPMFAFWAVNPVDNSVNKRMQTGIDFSGSVCEQVGSNVFCGSYKTPGIMKCVLPQ